VTAKQLIDRQRLGVDSPLAVHGGATVDGAGDLQQRVDAAGFADHRSTDHHHCVETMDLVQLHKSVQQLVIHYQGPDMTI